MVSALAVVCKEDKIHIRGNKPSTQSRFIVNERDLSPVIKQFVKGVLAHVGSDPGSSQEAC